MKNTFNLRKNKRFLIQSAIFIVVLIAIIFLYKSQFGAPQRKSETQRIVVDLSMTESDLISDLKSQGYIKSTWAFNFILKINGWSEKIEPGGYLISKSMSAWKLARILVSESYQKWVVIPEGLRATEIAEKLQKTFKWTDETKEEFLFYADEGYLFPDTYLLNSDYTGEQAARRMESQFNEKAGDILKQASAKDIRNDTVVILASIVQRETSKNNEMSIVAGIIWNRWLQDMPFQIDATVQYALGKEGNWWPVITSADYKIDSPYNTYVYSGKPPAPICNPGLSALEAVVNYQESDYLYYLHDKDGNIHLAKTYEEHLQNIEKYLK